MAQREDWAPSTDETLRFHRVVQRRRFAAIRLIAPQIAGKGR